MIHSRDNTFQEAGSPSRQDYACCLEAEASGLQSCNGTLSAKTPRLSVIIPVQNEERTIKHTLDRLHPTDRLEVIVVDGESVDQTSAVARSLGATVTMSKLGRGVQMNAGAMVASGDILLFLHADTMLPAGFELHVIRALANPQVSAGAFKLRIDAPGRSFRLVERVVHYRSRFLQSPYGDQALFIRAETFHEVGGFPNWPIMEDYDLLRRLRRVGRIEIVPASVLTSARRWQDHGVWQTTLRNHACVAAYWLGISPNRISRWRGP